jgi:hypothetical protein
MFPIAICGSCASAHRQQAAHVHSRDAAERSKADLHEAVAPVAIVAEGLAVSMHDRIA